MEEIRIVAFQRLKPRQAVQCPREGCLKLQDDCKACRYLIGVEYDGMVYCSCTQSDRSSQAKMPTIFDNVGSFL